MKILFWLSITSVMLLSSSIRIPDLQSIRGAWHMTTPEGTAIRIMADNFYSETFYNLEAREFQSCSGGSWTVSNGELRQSIEFHTLDNSLVGSVQTLPVELTGDKLQIGPNQWVRLDSMVPGKLAGAWLFAGRERNGQISRREPGPRKTMKMLSGTRFQWIAYNTDTKEFMGTGGGIYTTTEGKYRENIEFFSRDSSRVGANLEFEFEMVGQEWHHRGLSSKGEPIHEIWSPRVQ